MTLREEVLKNSGEVTNTNNYDEIRKGIKSKKSDFLDMLGKTVFDPNFAATRRKYAKIRKSIKEKQPKFFDMLEKNKNTTKENI